jgi:hypothetical protein
MPAGNTMPGIEARLTDIGGADAIAAQRARDADTFVLWEPSRPAPMHVGAGWRWASGCTASWQKFCPTR